MDYVFVKLRPLVFLSRPYLFVRFQRAICHFLALTGYNYMVQEVIVYEFCCGPAVYPGYDVNISRYSCPSPCSIVTWEVGEVGEQKCYVFIAPF